jgi:hypothetical protein
MSVYPVGLLRDLRQFAHGLHRPRSVRRLRYALRYPFHQARAGEWRAVKNYFNGYLAEPDPWPPGATRCGTGWTKRRAARDFERSLRKDVTGCGLPPPLREVPVMDRDQLTARIAQALKARDKARRRVPFRKAAADRLFTAAVMHDVDEYAAAQKPAPRRRPAPKAAR